MAFSHQPCPTQNQTVACCYESIKFNGALLLAQWEESRVRIPFHFYTSTQATNLALKAGSIAIEKNNID